MRDGNPEELGSANARAFVGLRRMRGPRARQNFSQVDTLRANNCEREGALPAARALIVSACIWACEPTGQMPRVMCP